MLQSLVKKFRMVMGLFREKGTARIDDHELEHLLLYHGLVGTSPENQRAFRDVRVDIFDAVKAGSPLQLGVALKVHPLHWQDKLEKIFAEVALQHRQNVESTLLPDTEGNPWPNISDPLGHDDWRVRANAAFALGSLGMESGVERMVKALHDTASSASPAFCHLAAALARLQNVESKRALLEHLNDPEPWFRVDAAAALAQFPATEVKEQLMNSLLTINPLSDYLSVALSKRFQVLALLNDNAEDTQRGGLQLLIGLMDAATQTFNPEVLQETDLGQCAEKILEILSHRRDIYALKAAQGLCSLWTEKKDVLDVSIETEDMEVLIARLNAVLNEESMQAEVIKVLETYAQKSTASGSAELLNSIKLAGALALASAAKSLLQLLKVESPLREDIVSALGAIGDVSAAAPLVQLGGDLYKPEERNSQSLSGKPVEENDNARAKLYWRILQALGNLPADVSADYLLNATLDFAPDKRQQALESLQNICKSLSKEQRLQFEEIVNSSLSDFSTPVKVAALKGIGALNAVQHVDTVLKMSDSQEPSISRQSFATLKQLAQSHNKKVLDAINQKLSRESDPRRVNRLKDLLNN